MSDQIQVQTIDHDIEVRQNLSGVVYTLPRQASIPAAAVKPLLRGLASGALVLTMIGLIIWDTYRNGELRGGIVQIALSGFIFVGSYSSYQIQKAAMNYFGWHQVIRLNRRYLRSATRALMLSWTRKVELEKLRRLQVVSNDDQSAGDSEDNPNSSLLAFQWGGEPVLIVDQYPHAVLVTVANDIANRCNEWLNQGATPDHRRTVTVGESIDNDELLDEYSRQPPDSKATVENTEDGISISLPPAGILKGAQSALHFSVIVFALMVITIAVMALTASDWHWYWIPAVEAVPGIILLLYILKRGRSRAIIDVVNGQMLISIAWLLSTRQYLWPANTITQISSTKSSGQASAKLRIESTLRKPVKLFAGRPMEELQWLAALLESELHAAQSTPIDD